MARGDDTACYGDDVAGTRHGDKWFWNKDADGNVIVGRGNKQSDVVRDELDDFYLGQDEHYGHLWKDGLDQVFGRMSPEQVRGFGKMSGDHGTMTVVGGLGETLEGSLIRDMLYKDWDERFPRASLHVDGVLANIERDFKGIRGRPRIDTSKGSRYMAFQDLRTKQAKNTEFQNLMEETYGIHFPGWRQTGSPTTNTRRMANADVDVWLHQGRSVSPALDRDIRKLFPTIPDIDDIDNYNVYTDWGVRKPFGGVTFYQGGQITRKPSPWDSFDKLSPAGQDAFRQYMQDPRYPFSDQVRGLLPP